MAVPALYNTPDLRIDTTGGGTIWRSPTYPMFGPDNYVGLWLQIIPNNPQFSGNLIGFVHVSVGFQNQLGQTSLYTQPMTQELNFAYVFDQINRQASAQLTFYPQPYLGGFVARYSPVI